MRAIQEDAEAEEGEEDAARELLLLMEMKVRMRICPHC